MNLKKVKNLIREYKISIENDFFGSKVNFRFKDEKDVTILTGYYEYDLITDLFINEKCFVEINKAKINFNDDIKFIFVYAKQKVFDELHSTILHIKTMLYNKLSGVKNYGTLLDDYENAISVALAKTIPKEHIMYRARVGMKSYVFAKESFPTMTVFTPHNREEICNPPSKFVRQNRFNHEGRSVYYLATDIDTCISELKVLVGEDISIAKFKSIDELKLIDFSIDYQNIGLEAIKTICISTVGNDNNTDYILTNYFSDIFKSSGYDGIYYKSSQGGGKNICCFSPLKIELIKFSEELLRITSNKYEYILSPKNLINKPIEDTLIDFIEENYDDKRIKYIKEWIEKSNHRSIKKKV
ncbi:RES family NAD+ phosphorylase [Acholeplasma laidlawii]|uniref:RES family NAD+ phosphorylase n=1 Tax=Acholeplasma laidlawii TaxID=2148 RepID=UPI0021F6CC88|nr:RES family NAD+ phosphorylase [Acholeplasma laidlawii]